MIVVASSPHIDLLSGILKRKKKEKKNTIKERGRHLEHSVCICAAFSASCVTNTACKGKPESCKVQWTIINSDITFFFFPP